MLCTNKSVELNRDKQVVQEKLLHKYFENFLSCLEIHGKERGKRQVII